MYNQNTIKVPPYHQNPAWDNEFKKLISRSYCKNRWTADGLDTTCPCHTSIYDRKKNVL